MDPVFAFPNGDVDIETLVVSSCMLETFFSTFSMSWSHCGIVSSRNVNAWVTADMVGEVIVCRVELSVVGFLVRFGVGCLQVGQVQYAGVQGWYKEGRVGQRAVVKVAMWRRALAEVCSVPAAE